VLLPSMLKALGEEGASGRRAIETQRANSPAESRRYRDSGKAWQTGFDFWTRAD